MIHSVNTSHDYTKFECEKKYVNVCAPPPKKNNQSTESIEKR